MEDKENYTKQEMQEIIMHQAIIHALEHAIQRGKMCGDSAELVNPLVFLYNAYLSKEGKEESKT